MAMPLNKANLVYVQINRLLLVTCVRLWEIKFYFGSPYYTNENTRTYTFDKNERAKFRKNYVTSEINDLLADFLQNVSRFNI